MLTRRKLLQSGTIAGAGALLISQSSRVWADPVPGGTLDPTTIPKSVTQLFQLPRMPTVATSSTLDRYDIAVRQFAQQILPGGLPSTQVFGYGVPSQANTFHYPAYTVEARVGKAVRVRWGNQLVTSSGKF